MTTTSDLGGTYAFGHATVPRMGYGAMQLAGPRVFGPPADRAAAVAVLRAAVAAGITHIDTSDFYGPHITNQIIREALHPYPAELRLVTKLGAKRDERGAWPHARTPADLRKGVEDNLRNLGLEALDVVNLRMGSMQRPDPGSIAESFGAMVEMQREGLIRHIGLSTVNAEQIAEAQTMAPVVCVQNFYNVANREDDALIDSLAAQGIAYVPYFPLGGFTPLQSAEMDTVAARIGATPMQIALAWLLHRAPNVLLIPGTSSLAHLHENIAATQIVLTQTDREELDTIGKDAAP